MKHYEFQWKTSDGVQLYGQGWQPEGEAKAVVSLVHGLGEHSGRYPHMAECLASAGYALVTFDLRGHGKSNGRRGHTPSIELLFDDIDHLLDEAARRYPGLPRFLYGHSLGGNLVLNYTLRRLPRLAGVIATGPWLRLAGTSPAAKLVLGSVMDRVWPSMAFANGLDPQDISRDPAVVSAYIRDPLVHDRLSARLGIGAYRSGAWALEHAREFPLPLLLMHGDSDHITSPEASREFAEQAGSRCTFKAWEGCYHEIHNEPEQKQVFATLLNWLDNRCEREALPASSGAALDK